MCSDSFLLQEIGDGLPLTVFLPGWAMDYRVFGNMDLPTNRLFPLDPFSKSVHGELSACIRANGRAQVTLMGWSLGGFVAADFAGLFPELVSSLILCGVRTRYSAEQIETTRQGVLDARKHFLMSFYRQCFLPVQKEDYQRFRDNLMPCYLDEMNTDYLLTSLDYLAQVEMNADSLRGHPVVMIHGAQDIVAPVHEVMAISASADNVQLHIFPNAGHAAFLTAESRKVIRQCLR